MSLGQGIGTVIGGAVGFVIGGPMGMLKGAALGYSVGSWADPVQQEAVQTSKPEIAKFSITTAEEGVPIKDLLGTSKITGNYLWYGQNRSIEQTETQSTGGGGKGGGGGTTQTVTTGYQYRLTWAEGICLGPIDTLLSIYRGDDCIWEGELEAPSDGGSETITLPGMGSMTFYFGTAEQEANTTWANLLDDSTLHPAYRNLCYAFYNDCIIGDYNRAPVMKYVVRKTPTFDFNSYETIQEYDYNPAHALYYIMTEMIGMDTSFLDEDDFSEMADYLFYNEDKGLSIVFSSQKEALTYLELILGHISAIIRHDIDGQLHPILLRNNIDTTDMISINEEDMLEPLQMERPSWLDTKNKVEVKYLLRYFGKTCAGKNITDDGGGDNCTNIAPTLTNTICNSDEDDPDMTGWGRGLYTITDGCAPFRLYYRDDNMADYLPVRAISGREFTYMCGVIECSGQEEDRYIKIIDGKGQESNVIDISITAANPPAFTEDKEISPGGSVDIIVAEGTGRPSFDYEVTFGEHVFFDAGLTLTELTTNDRQVTVYSAAEICCDDVTIKVTDYCGNVDYVTVTGEDPEDFAFDDDSTPDTIVKNSNIEVYVTGGCAPFTFATSSTGYDFEGSASYETDNRNATLNCADGDCGVDFDVYCDLTVTDACGGEVTAEIRNTGGGWVLVDTLIGEVVDGPCSNLVIEGKDAYIICIKWGWNADYIEDCSNPPFHYPANHCYDSDEVGYWTYEHQDVFFAGLADLGLPNARCCGLGPDPGGDCKWVNSLTCSGNLQHFVISKVKIYEWQC